MEVTFSDLFAFVLVISGGVTALASLMALIVEIVRLTMRDKK